MTGSFIPGTELLYYSTCIQYVFGDKPLGVGGMFFGALKKVEQKVIKGASLEIGHFGRVKVSFGFKIPVLV